MISPTTAPLRLQAHLLGTLAVLLLAVASISATAPSAAAQTAKRVIDVGPAWAGTRVGYNAVHAAGRYFVGYYDAERSMVLAIVDPASGDVRRIRMDSHYRGFDSHNEVVLAVDNGGRVHIVGNMHATPLVYFTVDPPYTSAQPGRMIGQNESRSTYPTFLQANNDLLFVYRDGSPGNGRWLVNRWDGSSWQRALPVPLLGDRDGSDAVSASVPHIFQGADGIFRMVILWRTTGSGIGNYKVTFARSVDFKIWTNSAGREIRLPLTPENTETIIAPGVNQGLGQVALTLDKEGNPVMRVRKTTKDGKLGIFVARRKNGEWIGREVAVEEQGSVPPIRLPLESDPPGSSIFVSRTSGNIVSCLGMRGATGRCQELDYNTLSPLAVVQPPESWLYRYAEPSAEVSRPLRLVLPAKDQQLKNTKDAYLVWIADRLTAARARECRRVIECKGGSSLLRLVVF